ncbi:MAG: glycosyltransferase [Bacilli bacterium]
MRIGIFTDTYTPYISGLVTSELMLKQALEKKGHVVYVVTANLENFKYDFDEDDKVIRVPGIPTGIYDARLTGIYPIQAVNKIKSWHLDVIHSQSEFGVGTFARIIAKQFNIPIVHTYHTMYEDYIHYITHGHFDKSSKKLVEYLTLFYCDKTITELIVPTKKAYDLFKEKYNVQRNIHIVPTGIETERFYAENIPRKDIVAIKKKYNITSKDFVFVFVGRLAEEKNIEFLLDITKDLVKDYPNMKLLIIGDGPDKEKYEGIVSANHNENNVIFTGKVPWDTVPIYYQVADIFITASTTETQGLTVIEAMAGSLPVVCIDDESFRNVVIDGLNGELFNNKEEAKAKIINLYLHPDDKKQMGKQARINADRYSSKYFAEAVLDVYEMAIDSKKKSRNIVIKLWDKVRGKDK